MQQILCIANMNLKNSVQAIFTLFSNVFKIGKLKLWKTGLSYFFLNLGEAESDENDNRDFEILFHFEEAIVAE